ncbi:hypothetical protein EYF80_015391 [Liparis tanakae]|uniref:Uncharacterized protein n=1 Tax=Liparis tanakae TaxID=230148 RepID=A0A4Z2IAK7_9TELE|nr:hypothetical protein EYF80_015391 [Liparis tanakae]
MARLGVERHVADAALDIFITGAFESCRDVNRVHDGFFHFAANFSPGARWLSGSTLAAAAEDSLPHVYVTSRLNPMRNSFGKFPESGRGGDTMERSGNNQQNTNRKALRLHGPAAYASSTERLGKKDEGSRSIQDGISILPHLVFNMHSMRDAGAYK